MIKKIVVLGGLFLLSSQASYGLDTLVDIDNIDGVPGDSKTFGDFEDTVNDIVSKQNANNTELEGEIDSKITSGSLGTAATRAAADDMNTDASLPDVAAIKAYATEQGWGTGGTDLSEPGEIGGTTPAAATFTTLSVGSGGMTVDADGDVEAKSVSTSRVSGASQSVSLQEDPDNGDNKSTLVVPDSMAADSTKDLTKLVENDDDIGQPLYSGSISANTTLTTSQIQGQHYIVTAEVTITLPAVFDGGWGCFQVYGANEVTIDPNASDLIILNGTALTDGDAIVSGGTTGESVCLQYYDATGWITWGGGTWGGE